MTIVVACTLPPFKMSGDPHNWNSWLQNAEAVNASVDDDVVYFCALETDDRGLVPFRPLLARLAEFQPHGPAPWTFSINDGVKVVGTSTRLRRICMGHNLCGTYALEETDASHVLWLASDTQAPDDVLPRLLELDVAAAACHIPTYCLDGPRVPFPLHSWHKPNCPHLEYTQRGGEYKECICGARAWDVRTHMESCACMLLRRDVINRLKWRTSGDDGTTDDPSMHMDLVEFLDEELYVRHDVCATHWPESIPAIEHRHTEQERTVVRQEPVVLASGHIA